MEEVFQYTAISLKAPGQYSRVVILCDEDIMMTKMQRNPL